jgi:hypothetical protein
VLGWLYLFRNVSTLSMTHRPQEPLLVPGSPFLSSLFLPSHLFLFGFLTSMLSSHKSAFECKEIVNGYKLASATALPHSQSQTLIQPLIPVSDGDFRDP